MASQNINRQTLSKTFLQKDVLISSGVISILLIMILPVPTVVMDFLLALNISLSLVVVFLYAKTSQFIFPGMLLILTLFRLA